MTYSPAARLLTALDLLQSRPSMTAAQLAERLEVNTRSARRYITMLQDLGIPIEAERGRYGGYRLRPGFKLPPLMLTEGEALAVTLGLLAAERLGFASAVPAVEGALAKVERVLPLPLRERVRAVQQTVALGFSASPVALMSQYMLTLSTAAYREQRVRLRYRSKTGEETERAIDPYGLVYRAGLWYVVGYCHLRHELRTFRLDRVTAAELCDEAFTRPAGFDCLAYAIQAFAAIPDEWLVEALLETSLDQVRRSAPPEFATLEETAAGVMLRAYDNNLEHMARFLIGLGCPLHVRQPPELLDALQRIADEVMRVVVEGKEALEVKATKTIQSLPEQQAALR